MGGIFGGGGSKPTAGEQLSDAQAKEKQAEPKADNREAEQQAAALRARRRRGSRALLSGTREEAQTGLSSKLGGGS